MMMAVVMFMGVVGFGTISSGASSHGQSKETELAVHDVRRFCARIRSGWREGGDIYWLQMMDVLFRCWDREPCVLSYLLYRLRESKGSLNERRGNLRLLKRMNGAKKPKEPNEEQHWSKESEVRREREGRKMRGRGEVNDVLPMVREARLRGNGRSQPGEPLMAFAVRGRRGVRT